MSDKVQKIKQEIERLKTQNETYLDKEYAESTKWYKHGAYDICFQLLNFIDSIPEEPVSEDLDDYYKKEFLPKEWFAKPGHRTISQFNFFTAKHFAEWQKHKDQETIELAEDHAMLAGMNKMKEEMMKDAVEGRVQCGWGDGNKLSIKAMLPQDSDLKYADKVKVLILKTE